MSEEIEAQKISTEEEEKHEQDENAKGSGEEEEEKKEENDKAWDPLWKPVNTNPPNAIELKATQRLKQYMEKSNTFADKENMEHRFHVIEQLSSLVDEFIEKIRVKKGVEPDEDEGKLVGKLFYSGSFKLGVCFPDSYIDLLCVAPQFVQLTDFFSVFYDILSSSQDCKELIKVEEAYVPIMKMNFNGVDIDMCFAALSMRTIPPDINLAPDVILENISKISVRALNSLRVNNMVLGLVPNVDNFKELLRFVRHWAHSRGLYGNVYGYFGGINLTLLSAFVCERYPTASVAMLIFYFFLEVSNWKWPHPLYINTPNVGEMPSWDPSTDHNDVMPIITPAYPSTNSLRSATKSSRIRIVKEMSRGCDLMESILTGEKEWDVLCEPTDFFTAYKSYIKIEISADEQADFNWWSGAVISKIKGLIIALENVPYINSTPIFPNPFNRKEGDSFYGTLFIAVVSEKLPEGEKIQLTAPVKKFLEEAYKIKDRPRTSTIDTKIIKFKDMPDYVFPGGVKPKKKHNKNKKKSKSEKSKDSKKKE